MNNGEKNIDRIFRERLRNFDAEPPVEVWDNINEKLSLGRRKKTILWITRVAAGMAILAALSLTYYIGRKSVKEGQLSGNKEIKTEEKLPEENTGTLPGEELNNQKIEDKIQTAYTDLSHAEGNNASMEYARDYSFRLLPPSVSGKRIYQLNYNYPGPESMASSLESSGKPAGNSTAGEKNLPEELYALNIPEEEPAREGRWAVGTEISPLYSYRSLDAQNEAMSLTNDLNKSESGTLAYSGGVNVNYSPLRRLSLQSGIYYSRYGVNVDNAYVFEDATGAAISNTKYYSINSSSGVIDIANNPSVDYVTNRGDHKNHSTGSSNLDQYSMEITSGEVTQNFEYIEVPLILKYRLIDRKIGFNLLGGLSTNLLVGSNTYYHADGNREKIGETTDIKPFNYSSIVGLGLDYSISKHLKINLEPSFRYYLNSINESSVIRSYPYSIGIFTGLRYNF
jgi:hypothetical protein